MPSKSGKTVGWHKVHDWACIFRCDGFRCPKCLCVSLCVVGTNKTTTTTLKAQSMTPSNSLWRPSALATNNNHRNATPSRANTLPLLSPWSGPCLFVSVSCKQSKASFQCSLMTFLSGNALCIAQFQCLNFSSLHSTFTCNLVFASTESHTRGFVGLDANILEEHIVFLANTPSFVQMVVALLCATQ